MCVSTFPHCLPVVFFTSPRCMVKGPQQPSIKGNTTCNSDDQSALVHVPCSGAALMDFTRRTEAFTSFNLILMRPLLHFTRLVISTAPSHWDPVSLYAFILCTRKKYRIVECHAHHLAIPFGSLYWRLSSHRTPSRLRCGTESAYVAAPRRVFRAV